MVDSDDEVEDANTAAPVDEAVVEVRVKQAHTMTNLLLTTR